MEKSKIQTYLGFCVRARKLVYGTDEIEAQKKGVFLIVFDEGLGESSLKTLIKTQERLACPMVQAAAGELGNALHKSAVKAVAVKDKNLALAILSVIESESQFKLYSGGSK